ncbi:MAG TPA: response regulator [Polyangia bacterium]|jgi:DNA-binding response OmpR family regulator
MEAVKRARTLDRARVLLVDDDDDTCTSVADVLALHGAIVTTASSGNTGLRAFLREPPEIVLSDLWMPDGDGFELIRNIRAREPHAGGLTPAIAFSAVEHLRAAMMAGYHAFTPKPFELPSLLALIANFTRDDEIPRLVTPWTVQTTEPGIVSVRLQDEVRGADMRNLMHALAAHLEAGPVDVLVDLRELRSFSPSVGSVGERALWSRRRQIRSLRVEGGPLLARLVSAAACRVLGIPCSADVLA